MVDDTRAVPLMHYTGTKKVLPPRIQTSGTSISVTDMCARNASLTAAQENDMIWLNSLIQENAMGRNWFNK